MAGMLAVFVVALAIAFVNLGFWQLARLDQRRAMNNSVITHENSTPVELRVRVRPHHRRSRPMAACEPCEGTFDADHQYLVRYRSNGDEQSGYEVITPLHTTTGASVLVDRGFGVKAANDSRLPVRPARAAGGRGEHRRLRAARRARHGRTR